MRVYQACLQPLAYPPWLTQLQTTLSQDQYSPWVNIPGRHWACPSPRLIITCNDLEQVQQDVTKGIHRLRIKQLNYQLISAELIGSINTTHQRMPSIEDWRDCSAWQYNNYIAVSDPTRLNNISITTG